MSDDRARVADRLREACNSTCSVAVWHTLRSAAVSVERGSDDASRTYLDFCLARSRSKTVEAACRESLSWLGDPRRRGTP